MIRQKKAHKSLVKINGYFGGGILSNFSQLQHVGLGKAWPTRTRYGSSCIVSSSPSGGMSDVGVVVITLSWGRMDTGYFWAPNSCKLLLQVIGKGSLR